MPEANAAATAGGRHQRRLKNYLVDPGFQLKYSAYLMGITGFLSVVLGTFLWRTSEAVIEQSAATVGVAERSVHVGEQVVTRGREVVEESKKVSAVVKMNIVRDPVYSDNPGLLEAFQEDAKAQDARLIDQQSQLEGQAKSLKSQSLALKIQRDNILNQQKAIGAALTIGLLLLVFGVGFAGIIVTHKIAGPVFKMKRQIRELGEGNFTIPYPLRKGDELREFFEVFRETVRQLRIRQEDEIKLLDEAITSLDGKATDADMKPLVDLRAEMQSALDA